MKGSLRLEVLALLACAFLLAGCPDRTQQDEEEPVPPAPDTTAPTVIAVSPLNAATNVALNGLVTATFSEAMDDASLNAGTFVLAPTTGGLPLTGLVSMGGNTASFAPAANLVPNTQYTASITTGARDVSGNPLASSYAWSFTTMPPDSTPPTVSSTLPVATAIDVALNASVFATFSEAMNASTLNTSTFTLAPTAGGPAIAGTVNLSGTTASFDPSGNMAGSTQYTATITIGAQDSAGNPLAADYSWTFTTVAPDTTPPTVSTTNPGGGATGVSRNTSVSATFSEAMNNATLNTVTFTLAPTAGGPAVAGAVGLSGNTATFTPSAALAASTQYTATISTGAQDASGNPLAANYTWSFTTAAGTAVAACPVGGPPALAVAASRTSGVAPLAVFFDATATTSPVTTRPFHEVEYRWDFGDPGSGSWTNTPSMPNLSRNSARGPMSAHVFENGGTYTVVMTASDGTSTASCSVDITVQSADGAFSGNSTICFSTSGTFTDAPAGFCTGAPTQITTSNFASAIATYAAPGRRLLFRGGETFLTSGAAVLRVSGPGVLGSYGTGKARLRSTSGGGLLDISSASTPGLADWRVMDLELDGQSAPNSSSITGRGGFDQLTLLRLDIHDIALGFSFFAGFIDGSNTALNTPHHVWDQLAIVDNTLRRIGGGAGGTIGQGAFLAATRLTFMGNLVDDTTRGEHPVRVQYASRMVFNNNTMRAAPGTTGPGGSKETLTIRAPNSSGATGGGAYFPRVFPAPGQVPASGAVTERILVSDNQFLISGYVGVATNEVNNTIETRMREFLFERNWYRALPTTGIVGAMDIRSPDTTIRNEIIDLTGFSAHVGIRLMSAIPAGPGCPPTGCMSAASNVRVLNNSIYSASTGNFVGIRLEPGISSITLQNNLGYAPNATVGSIFMIDDQGASGVATCPVDGTGNTCNSSNSQAGGTTPGWSIANPMTPPTRYRPQASYAVDRGVAAPAFSDFFLVPRTAPHDLGAVNP